MAIGRITKSRIPEYCVVSKVGCSSFSRSTRNVSKSPSKGLSPILFSSGSITVVLNVDPDVVAIVESYDVINSCK